MTPEKLAEIRFKEKLIESVRRRLILWDVQDPRFKLADKKPRQWAEVASELDMNYESKKFKILT